MSATGYPLAVMHHYEMATAASADFLKQVARGDVEEDQGHRAGVEEPPGASALRRGRAAGDRRRQKPSKIVVSALGVREGFLYSLLSEEEQRRDPLISASEELGAVRAPAR